MKLVKSLLLGSAAALSTVAGAQAADLPVRKAAPVEYVQLCPAFGRGFFTIPGTDTCLSISGFARLEIGIAEQLSDAQDIVGWRARGRLNFDARTATAFGPVRAYIRLDARTDSGSPFGAGFVAPVPGGSVIGAVSGRDTREVRLEQAYVQWGGLIAGRTTTFFSPGPRNSYFIGPRFDDATDTELLGYVYDATTGGTGFELAVSVENQLNRRTNANVFGTTIAGASLAVAGGPTGAFFGGAGDIVTPFVYAGSELPDFVGRATYRGSWGYAYVAGAVHQVNDFGTPAVAAGAPTAGVVGGQVVVVPGAAAIAARPDAGDEIGFAVSAAIDVNLPFLAAGSTAFALFQYADGAVSYAGYGSSARIGGAGLGIGGTFGFTGFSGGFGGGGLPVADAVVVNGSLETTEVLSVAAGLQHYWLPQLRSQFYGSYSSVDFAGGASATILGGAFAGAQVGFVDFEEIRIGGNLIYSPVSGLDLGVEVLYTAVDPRGQIVVERPAATAAGVDRRLRGDVDILETRLRVSRSF